ncbi:MAG: hypothetical protein IJP92_09930 [Lachnospiraceae bacterium]|nr:hypothetical protein [Lachnospiraceae bacterium]
MKQYLIRLATALFCLLLLSGCDAEKLVVTNGFARDEVFRVETSACTTREISVYLVNLQNEYAEIAAPGEAVKETCLNLASQVKIMNLMAERMNITLEGPEITKAQEAAEAYYRSLTEADITAMEDVTQENIRRMYLERALADKVYAYAVRDINPEISDDEARTITVEQIMVRKGTDAGKALQKITEAEALIAAGDDFAQTLQAYNEAETARVSFGTGEGDGIPEQEAFALETGQISGILETDTAYYLLRCVSSFDREQTRENKARIVRRRKHEAFGKMYDSFVEEVTIELNEPLWESLEIPEGGHTTSSFWTTYESFFGEE